MSCRLLRRILSTVPQFFLFANFESLEKIVEIEEAWNCGIEELWNCGRLKVIFGAPDKRTGRHSAGAKAALNKAAAARALQGFGLLLVVIWF
jgi:hypothetical protein